MPDTHALHWPLADAPPRNAAMSVALALAEAAGRADGRASRATVPFDPAMERLRYRLLLWAACTRDDRLRHLLPEFRGKARSAVRAYRTLRGGRP